MPWLLIVILAVHVVSTVFWAGSSFTMARLGAMGGERLFRPQLGAATVAILSGAYLWWRLHDGGHSRVELVLGVAVAAAVLAFLVQLSLGGSAVRRIGKHPDDDSARLRLAVVQRAASALLAITVIGMATARYLG